MDKELDDVRKMMLVFEAIYPTYAHAVTLLETADKIENLALRVVQYPEDSEHFKRLSGSLHGLRADFKETATRMRRAIADYNENGGSLIDRITVELKKESMGAEPGCMATPQTEAHNG